MSRRGRPRPAARTTTATRCPRAFAFASAPSACAPAATCWASAGWDQTVRLWQIPGGKQLARWDGVEGVVFSPDGRTFACGPPGNISDAENLTVRIIEVATGKERRRFRVATRGRVLFHFTLGHPLGFYSPDGKALALRQESGVLLYAVDSGKELGRLQANVLGFGRPVVFAPDSRSVLVAAANGFFRWTFGTGAKDKILADEKGTLSSFAFSPDGKVLAAVVDGTAITLRNWPAGRELRRLRMQDGDVGTYNVLAFSPDGKLLASSEGGTVCLWNAATGEPVRRFEGLQNPVWDLAFSPDGSLLAAGGGDGAVVVWEVRAVESPRPLTGLGHLLDLVGLAADGRTLLTRSADGVVTVWDSRDGRRLRTLADGEAGVDRALFGPEAGAARRELRGEVERGRKAAFFRQRLYCSAFSPDHAMRVLGSRDDGRILVLSRTAKGIEHRRLDDDAPAQEARQRGFPVAVSQMTFSPDSRTLAATYSDGRLILWDARTGRPHHLHSLPAHGEPYRSVEFSPDGRLLALSDRYALYLVELASGQRFRGQLLGGHQIDSLAFAPDNRTLAVGGAGPPGAIHLWDLPSNKQIGTLQGHRDGVETLVFSPDRTFLLSGGRDGTVLSWDVAAVLRRRPAGKDLSPARLSQLWADLASKDAVCAQRAVGALIQAPDAALPLLARSLPPVRPEEMARVASLIADLDHEEFTRREKAAKELATIGEPAAPALRKALAGKPSPEVRRRVEALLEKLSAGPLSPDGLRTVRALQVLETIGTPAARRSLEHLAGGAADAPLTLDAKAALRRLERRHTGP